MKRNEKWRVISNRSLLFLFALAAMWIIVMTTMNGVTSFLHGREVSHFEEAVQSKKPFPELITAYQNLLHVVGAKESQAELLKTLPSDPETHELDHETGAYLYKTFKEAGVHQCDKTFTGGCFHGFILALANTTGVDHIPEFVKICKSGMQGEQGWQCPHGAGHAFLVISGYTQLQKALEQCKRAFGENTIDTLNCYGGVFMENSFGPFKVPPPGRFYKPEDPMYPCNEPFVQNLTGAHRYCWVILSELLMHKDAFPQFGGQISRVEAYCEKLISKEDRKSCFDGSVRQIVFSHPKDWDGMVAQCRTLTTNHQDECIAVANRTRYFYGHRSVDAENVCENMRGPDKSMCYAELFKGFALSFGTKEKRHDACNTLSHADALLMCEKWMQSAASETYEMIEN